MTKDDIKTFGQLVHYARARATKSAKRNDPIAWAYWRETAKWAINLAQADHGLGTIKGIAETNLMNINDLAQADRFMEAAQLYARAKWLVFILRNNGRKFSMRGSLWWMQKLEYDKPA